MTKRLGILMVVAMAFAVAASPAFAQKKIYPVCAHGCKYRTIQKAVDAVKKGSSSIVSVKPGTYSEGVLVLGHKYDGLTIQGTSKDPKRTVLNGKNAVAKGDQPAQNAIEGINVDNLRMLNLTAKNYASNGLFVHSDPDNHCIGFLMKNDIAAFNRSYGLFAQNCEGGRITQSVGYGHGDSAIYIGQTPVQDKPKWTSIDHDNGYENVLGYSGTNSKYVDIHDDNFYNNGIGVVPNTLDSELYEPTADGKIRNNNIFWNDFDYWRASSKVLTVSSGLGAGIQYPIGVGIFMLGADGWKISNNNIFGNYMWGTAASSDPTNAGNNAVNTGNQYTNNVNGRGGKDKNQFDYFNDGSGTANCYSGNASQTLDVAGVKMTTDPVDYPACPGTGIGTGSDVGNGAQVARIVAYVTSDPPCDQENSWDVHSHPKYKNYKPLETTGDCTNLPSKAKASSASRSSKAGAGKATKTVTVGDDFYSPTTQTIKKGDKVKWAWNGTTSDQHNVTLKTAPKGVRKSDFRSATASSGSFTKKFLKPGKYHFICTIHSTLMHEDVTVKRP
jgi:plastocyanin